MPQDELEKIVDEDLDKSPKEHKEIIEGIYNRLGDAIRKLGEDD